MSDISSQLSQKYDELRNIGQELATLVGREPKFTRKRALTNDEDAPPAARRDIDRRISYENSDRSMKRSRLIENEPIKRNDRHENNLSPVRRPTMQSSVRMPTIETKSRDQTIAERERGQRGGEDGARNRRMFGNLLLGTLKQFQQEEKAPAAKVQHDKLKEVEEKLEKSGREEKQKFFQDKKTVEMKLREKEMEIKRLKQRKAIEAKTENKIAHYKRLQNFIQTETKPPIFFLPARLTLRGMELLKSSARNLDNLIKERQTEMENELRELDELSDGEIAPSIRSAVKVVSTDKDSRAHLKPMNGEETIDDAIEEDDDVDDDDDEDVFRIRSSVVVKSAKKEDPEAETIVNKDSNGEKANENATNSPINQSPTNFTDNSKGKADVEDADETKQVDNGEKNKVKEKRKHSRKDEEKGEDKKESFKKDNIKKVSKKREDDDAVASDEEHSQSSS